MLLKVIIIWNVQICSFYLTKRWGDWSTFLLPRYYLVHIWQEPAPTETLVSAPSLQKKHLLSFDQSTFTGPLCEIKIFWFYFMDRCVKSPVLLQFLLRALWSKLLPEVWGIWFQYLWTQQNWNWKWIPCNSWCVLETWLLILLKNSNQWHHKCNQY